MTNTTPPSAAAELWSAISKEITGIQILWEAVNGLYFQLYGRGLALMGQDAPLLFRLAQTALMESLLMRVSRLMDPAATGKLTNLSLKRLVVADSRIAADENPIREIWDGSALKTVRDKYLSHNDLKRAQTEEHMLNVPLELADIDGLRTLVEGLRELRRSVSQKLLGVAYLDQPLDLQVKRELSMVSNTLLGGEVFFGLLPNHELLQSAWQEVEHG